LHALISHAHSLTAVVAAFEDLCKDPDAETWMLDQLKAAGKADKLKGFEIVKKLILEPEMFSIENELLTPTFKFKRPQLQKKYQADIDAMYKALNE
jgi:long-chain acyl-CoA synthetase